MGRIVIASPSRPVTVMSCPNGDVMLLPALWPVRLTPDERRDLAKELLAYDEDIDG
jgi:hypothetical protein